MAAPGRVLLEAACALEFACWFRCKACFRVLLLTLWSWHAGAAMQGGQGVGCLKVLLLVRFGAGLLVPLQGAAVRVVRAFGDGRGLLVLCVRFGGGVLVPLERVPLQVAGALCALWRWRAGAAAGAIAGCRCWVSLLGAAAECFEKNYPYLYLYLYIYLSLSI